MRKMLLTFGSPLICLVVLAGIVIQNRTHVRPETAEPYHRTAKAAIEKIGVLIGPWAGMDEEVPQSALSLLKPNVIISRTYVDNTPGRRERSASLLVVQCREANNLDGHYPPICYPAHGKKIERVEPRDWQLGDLLIKGTEYEFSSNVSGEISRGIIYNFLVVPGRDICRDMQEVAKASEDYERRYYGAAQFQLVVPASYPREERDRVFKELIGPYTSVIRTLQSEGSKP